MTQYTHENTYSSKSEASRVAAGYRSRGIPVKITKAGGGYAVSVGYQKAMKVTKRDVNRSVKAAHKRAYGGK